MAQVLSDRDLQYDIEQFLSFESSLLDDRKLYEWLDLFTEDAQYRMPIRETLQAEQDGIARGELVLSHFDDDKPFLTLRVKRLDTGLAHAEQPASRTRRLITNVRIQRADNGDVIARSNFLIFQGRLERSDHFFVGRREDRLRQVDGQWKIARRDILLDQTVLPRSLTILI